MVTYVHKQQWRISSCALRDPSSILIGRGGHESPTDSSQQTLEPPSKSSVHSEPASGTVRVGPIRMNTRRVFDPLYPFSLSTP